jgi:hypothetical protein
MRLDCCMSFLVRLVHHGTDASAQLTTTPITLDCCGGRNFGQNWRRRLLAELLVRLVHQRTDVSPYSDHGALQRRLLHWRRDFGLIDITVVIVM